MPENHAGESAAHVLSCDRPLRLLVWSPAGVGNHYGGAGMFMHHLLGRHLPADWTCTLVHASPEQGGYSYFTEHVDLRRPGTRPTGLLSDYLALRRGLQWLQSNADRFDVFLGIDTFELTVRPATLAEHLGLPALVRPAIEGAGIRGGRWLSRLLGLPQRRQRQMRNLSGVVAISSAIRRSLLEVGIATERIHDIPNGVDITKFRPAEDGEKLRLRAALGWDPDTVTVVFVGGLSHRKRPLWLVQALANMPQESVKQLRVAFVGPERESGCRATLMEAAAAAGVADRIYWHDSTPNPADFYRAADMFCLPSAWEGMPNAMLEAMASGLPILGTRISGSDDLIKPGVNGFFVEDSRDLSETLVRLIESPTQRQAMGHNARALVETSYDFELTWSRYAAVMQQLVLRPNTLNSRKTHDQPLLSTRVASNGSVDNDE